jgi:protein-S-isoprenylcysteine O-methyltransferase Ste14
MAQLYLAYFLLILFCLLEVILRKDGLAKSTCHTPTDKDSTKLIGLAFVLILLSSVILQIFQWGTFHSSIINFIGVAIMLIGLVIRVWSMITLRQFYSRTLVITQDHRLVKKGPYSVIRHPGYLGTILVWTAAGLAMQNFLVFAVSAILMPIVYGYRIHHEEKMLAAQFGEEYVACRKRSWKLVPFIFF